MYNYIDFLNKQLYNHNREMERKTFKMSSVIMIKCSDGIVCGADSQETIFYNGPDAFVLKPGANDVDKVHLNDNLIVGIYGNSDITVEDEVDEIIRIETKDIIEIVKSVLETANTPSDFLNCIKNQLPYSYSHPEFSFFLGFKENDEYKIAKGILKQKQLTVKTEVILEIQNKKNRILSCDGYYCFVNPIIERDITCEEAEILIKEMITYSKNIQKKTMNVQTIDGEIKIKQLKK